MEFFKKYSSNTTAGSGNQSFCKNENETEIYTCRTLYKVFCGGAYTYSFLFTNMIDSTIADGEYCHRNKILDSWEIVEAKVGICSNCTPDAMEEPKAFYPLTFSGSLQKTVNPAEMFCSDGLLLMPETDQYICLEISYRGNEVPYLEENNIPSFMWENGNWVKNQKHPLACMVGCNRPVDAKIGFIGDSITQGLGTPNNTYTHYNAVAANILGNRYAYWNLGLGYGRGDDAATDSMWLFKAKQNDVVSVCFGVNDILKGVGDKIPQNLTTIVAALKHAGCKVVLQTIPPFDYTPEQRILWENANAFIQNNLKNQVDLVFDCVPILYKSANEPHMSGYGPHPNTKGCKLWGEALAAELQKIL